VGELRDHVLPRGQRGGSENARGEPSSRAQHCHTNEREWPFLHRPTKKAVGQSRAKAQWVRFELGPRRQVPGDLRKLLVLTLGSLPTPCLSPGPFAVISVMIGSLTESLLPSEMFMESINGTNTTMVNEEERDAARVEMVATITVLTGIFQVRGPQPSLAVNRVHGAPWLRAALLLPPLLPGGPGPPAVWLRGDLPLRPTGAWLHHRCLCACSRLPAQERLWGLHGREVRAAFTVHGEWGFAAALGLPGHSLLGRTEAPKNLPGRHLLF